LHAGDFEEGQRALEPFRALATPIADAIMPMPYPAIYEMTRHGGERSTGVHRSLFLEALDDGAVEAIVARMNAAATPQTMFQVRVLGGAMARVDADDTAFAHRDAAVLVTIMAGYEDPADRGTQRAWADGLLAEISGRASGVYANFLEAEGDARVREAYPTATYDRLAAIKLRYDPTNFFHHNQNIQPGRPLALLTAG
jgi:FAD/FMN-containing dehydrogenase